MANPIQFIREAKSELMKVVWPTRSQVIQTTLAVIAISLLVGIFLGAADYGLTKLLEYGIGLN